MSSDQRRGSFGVREWGRWIIAWALCLATPGFASTAGASEPVASEARCRAAGVRSLRLERAVPRGAPRIPGRNVCSQAGGPPAEFVPTLERVGQVHRQVAALFGLRDLEASLPDGIELVLAEDPLASLSSVASGESLRMGVLPGWSGQPPNAGVYAHELTHVLIGALSAVSPARYGAFAAHPALQETLPDLVALAVAGEVVERGADVPACLDRIRYVTEFQSYRYPESYFDEFFAWRRFERCCRTVERAGGEDPVSLHWRAVCADEDRRRAFGEIPDRFSRRPALDSAIGEYGELGHGLSLDPHQFGLPLASLWARVSRGTGIDMADLLRASLARVGHSGGIARFRCESGDPGMAFVREVEILGAATWVDSLRETLARPEDRRVLEEAVRSHGMEYLDRVDRTLLGTVTRFVYEPGLRVSMKAEGHPCADGVFNVACELSCVPLARF
jgi:hypothetical protein